ncbi:MAG TPA: hypothetical protein VFS04_03765 [Alphaproteobacteria bacterium]|nr:hypothetical protein [Alphaproteobacteria bacterium]
MSYAVNVRVTPVEHDLLIEECPHGVWRSKDNLHWTVILATKEEAEHFRSCADGLGYEIGAIRRYPLNGAG